MVQWVLSLRNRNFILNNSLPLFILSDLIPCPFNSTKKIFSNSSASNVALHILSIFPIVSCTCDNVQVFLFIFLLLFLLLNSIAQLDRYLADPSVFPFLYLNFIAFTNGKAHFGYNVYKNCLHKKKKTTTYFVMGNWKIAPKSRENEIANTRQQLIPTHSKTIGSANQTQNVK